MNPGDKNSKELDKNSYSTSPTGMETYGIEKSGGSTIAVGSVASGPNLEPNQK